MKVAIDYLTRVVCIGMLLLTTSCGPLSTDELAKEVTASIQNTWKNQGVSGVMVESLVLVHKGGNEYSGILETNEEGGVFRYSVEVIYDGANFQWEIIE